MSRFVQIKIFNDVLEQFFDYLTDNFSDYKSDIILARTATEFVRNSNPRLVVEKFMSSVLPYKKYVFDCNESFFLDQNFDHNLDTDNVMTAMKIKNIWTSHETTERQKAYIWLFFQKLIKAGEKVMS